MDLSLHLQSSLDCGPHFKRALAAIFLLSRAHSGLIYLELSGRQLQRELSFLILDDGLVGFFEFVDCLAG